MSALLAVQETSILPIDDLPKSDVGSYDTAKPGEIRSHDGGEDAEEEGAAP